MSERDEIINRNTELARQINYSAGSILFFLRRVLDIDPVTRTVAEVILNHIGAVTDYYQKFPHVRVTQSFDDVLQDRLAAHLNHRLRQIGRQLAHSRSATSGENDCLVDLLCHVERSRDISGCF